MLVPLVVMLTLLTSQGTMSQGVEERATSSISYEDYPYSIQEDGTLIYEGDMVYTCDDLPRLIGDPELPTARRALERCTELGFLPSTEGETLPDTGGFPPPSLVVPVALASGLVLAARSRRPTL